MAAKRLLHEACHLPSTAIYCLDAFLYDLFIFKKKRKPSRTIFTM